MRPSSTRIPRLIPAVDTANSTSLTLIDRIKIHDKEAWVRLVTLYTPFLHYWCRRWGVSRADADDVLQEVFQAISQNLKDFRREQTGHSFRGWIRGIARNKALSLRRRQKLRAEGGTGFYRQSLLIPDRTIDSIPDDTERDENEAISVLYEHALKLVRNEFEDRTWQAFWRAVVEGQAPAIIAEDLGVTAAAVRQAKSRVLRRLKVILGESTSSVASPSLNAVWTTSHNDFE
jgi:RNA polymerase sigma-70 factor (ECF subfamily)